MQRVLAAFEREGVAYAIFGATALNIHGLSTIDLQTVERERVTEAGLYLMKRDTVRLKDRADAALLKERFGLDD